MAGLDPAIHVFLTARKKRGSPGLAAPKLLAFRSQGAAAR